MRTIALVLSCCLCLISTVGLSQNHESTPKELTIGFIPSGDKESLKRGAFALAKKLQSDLGIPINIYIPKSYGSLLTAIKEKKVDFAFLTAASYVAAEKDSKIQVLLKRIWSEPFYYSIILTKKNSGLKKLEDLKGRRIAYVDTKSTSGYLYPQVMFKKMGWTDKIFKEVKFTGSHADSVLQLEQNKTDVIAVFSDDKEGTVSAWNKYAKDAKANPVRVLWQSEPIPNDPFCVRQEFYEQYPKVVHTLMFKLIDAVELLKDNKDVVAMIGAKGFLPATSRQYDPVRELVKELGLQVE